MAFMKQIVLLLMDYYNLIFLLSPPKITMAVIELKPKDLRFKK